MFLYFCCRLSRGERSGRYGSDGGRDEAEWQERRNRDAGRDYDRRWGDDRQRERLDEYRDRGRDSPEVSEKESSFQALTTFKPSGRKKYKT